MQSVSLKITNLIVIVPLAMKAIRISFVSKRLFVVLTIIVQEIWFVWMAIHAVVHQTFTERTTIVSPSHSTAPPLILVLPMKSVSIQAIKMVSVSVHMATNYIPVENVSISTNVFLFNAALVHCAITNQVDMNVAVHLEQ